MKLHLFFFLQPYRQEKGHVHFILKGVILLLNY